MFRVRADTSSYASYGLLQVKWWLVALWLRRRQQGALGLTTRVHEGTFMKRQRGTNTARTQSRALPTVCLRCVIFYQQAAGAGDVTAAEEDVECLCVVKGHRVVIVIVIVPRHQAGGVDGAEVTSINLRHATPCLSARGGKVTLRGHVMGQLGSCEGRGASPIIIPDGEPVDLRGVLRRRPQGTVHGEAVIVDALETRVRSWRSTSGDVVRCYQGSTLASVLMFNYNISFYSFLSLYIIIYLLISFLYKSTVNSTTLPNKKL